MSEYLVYVAVFGSNVASDHFGGLDVYTRGLSYEGSSFSVSESTWLFFWRYTWIWLNVFNVYMHIVLTYWLKLCKNINLGIICVCAVWKITGVWRKLLFSLTLKYLYILAPVSNTIKFLLLKHRTELITMI